MCPVTVAQRLASHAAPPALALSQTSPYLARAPRGRTRHAAALPARMACGVKVGDWPADQQLPMNRLLTLYDMNFTAAAPTLSAAAAGTGTRLS
jgi:hypothetical protein